MWRSSPVNVGKLASKDWRACRLQETQTCTVTPLDYHFTSVGLLYTCTRQVTHFRDWFFCSSLGIVTLISIYTYPRRIPLRIVALVRGKHALVYNNNSSQDCSQLPKPTNSTMRFGQTLRKSVYPPWKDNYLEYGKLKAMLREDADDDRAWTEEDEHKFCEEILNVQLEKIAAFQASTFKGLEERASKTGEKLRELSPEDGKAKGDTATGKFKEIEEELDAIINETKELKKYSNINFTGFLKIAKKHDRKRGNNYKIKPMIQLSLQKQTFNSEHKYSPLLNKLSMMYFVVRQQLDENVDGTSVTSDAQAEVQNGERYTAYKCKSTAY